MNFFQTPSFNKKETVALGILMYAIAILYIYQFSQIANKYHVFTPDEFLYYTEAKAIAAYGNFKTPLSLDGNTSILGEFGYHGVSYAIKNAILAKAFFQAEDPPLLFINILTLFATLAFILSFKKTALNARLKIALVIATHSILFTYTFSYMQETIHYFLGIVAVGLLYCIYQYPENKKKLFYYIALVIISISFRYSWAFWGMALLPLATDKKSAIKWGLVIIGLFAFAIFIAKYIYAPSPYTSAAIFSNAIGKGSSITTLIGSAFQKFFINIKAFIEINEDPIREFNRYLLLFLLLTSAWYSFVKQNKFVIACTLVAWSYFIGNLAFYIIADGHDARMLAILNPLLTFCLISSCNTLFFYPIIAVHLLVLPMSVKETTERNQSFITLNETQRFRSDKEFSFSKIGNLITDDKPVVILTSTAFTYQGNPDYFLKFPLITQKGYPIHYYTYVNGNDLRKKYKIDYVLNTDSEEIKKKCKLVYSDNWITLYKEPD